jgi:hypothetical protein
MATWPDKDAVELWAKIVGGIFALIGLAFTAYQIMEAKNVLIFNNEVAVQKEARDILKFLAENPAAVQNMQLADVAKLNERDRITLNAQIGWVLNFYNSSLQKPSEAYFSQQFRNSLTRDFCLLARFPQIAARLNVQQADQPYFFLSSVRRSNCNA